MMTDTPDPKELAKAVVLETLRADTAGFVAMQYLGLIDQRNLEQLFGDALRPEMVEVATPAHDPILIFDATGDPPQRTTWTPPTANRRIRVMEQPLVRRRPPPAMTEKRQLFIDWMEKRIPDDDPRVRAAFLTAMGGGNDGS